MYVFGGGFGSFWDTPCFNMRCVARWRRGGRGGGRFLLCPFLKIGKKSPNLKKRQPNCCEFFLVRSFFLVLWVNVYQNGLIPRKLPCPKKFLVTRLNMYLWCGTCSEYVWQISVDELILKQQHADG